MSREIKFRVWSLSHEKWITEYVNLRMENCKNGPCGCVIYDDKIESSWIMDDEENIVQQFTGIKDKNGREIYEGDWVKFTPKIELYCDEFTGEIFYREEEAAFYHTFEEDRPAKRFFNLPKEWDLEVIGNNFEKANLTK